MRNLYVASLTTEELREIIAEYDRQYPDWDEVDSELYAQYREELRRR